MEDYQTDEPCTFASKDNFERMSEVVKDAPCDDCEHKCQACYNGIQCTAFGRWVEMARYVVSWEKSWTNYERDRKVRQPVEPTKGILLSYDPDGNPKIVHIKDIHNRYSNDKD